MSDTASLEVSRELFEISGWEYDIFRVGNRDNATGYSAGYLLRKLPEEATSKKHGGYHYMYVHHGKNDWYAYYGEIDTTELMASGDTPEDALAKLAIELHKAGILPISGRD